MYIMHHGWMSVKNQMRKNHVQLYDEFADSLIGKS